MGSLIRVSLVAVLLAGASWVGAQEVDHTLGLRQIQPGYYVFLHGDSAPGISSTFNSGIIVTHEGVVVIDALGSPDIAREVRAAISSVTSQPVRYLITSSFHKEFTGGNSVYADAIRISHENARADLLQFLQQQGASAEERARSLPQLTYRDRITIYLGGKEIQVLFLGRAHTRGDSIVFVPQDRIAYLSEVFDFDEFPYISNGYSADWMQTLEAAQALPVDIVVPGHGFLPKGPNATRAALRRQWQILKDVRDAVQEQIRRGATEDAAVAAVQLPQYQHYKGYSRALEIAVRRIYRELTVGLP
jgi:glyoxylase-like metal-dependent hydrolase (beta-lactamase superfamily II)